MIGTSPVAGAPPDEAGRIELPLRKVSQRGGWKMEAHPEGQASITDYRVAGRGDGITWLELHPRTGRTHQIRVHCAALGCPVVGDPVYGSADDGGLQLHSRAVTVPLYPSRAPIEARAPAPPHLLAALRRCGFAGD